MKFPDFLQNSDDSPLLPSLTTPPPLSNVAILADSSQFDGFAMLYVISKSKQFVTNSKKGHGHHKLSGL